MKRMLINATHGVRVALIDGQTLYDLDIERTQKQTVNNIYLGKVNRVEPSLGAAFVDFGSTRDGFLPIKEVAREYFKSSYKHTPGERINIKDVLEPGQQIIVQVAKEERGNKGAALKTFVSLAGRYLVLMPNNPRAGGISRQIEGEERDELKYNINQLEVPDGMGVIVRTAGVGRTLEELQWDFEFLLSQWKAITEATHNRPAPFLIYQESDVITRALRDNLKPEIEEILIDNKEAYEHAKEHLTHTRPEFLNKLKFYDDSDDPLFNRYQVEAQIESAFHRVVALTNGASIVIDPTEALTAIDINSAKATEGSDIEETALMTNIAAAKEIARQLRLRDLGGLIVIDFIDMTNPKHQREVEKQLREELQKDRARVQMGRITRFGLLEMSRQRLQPSLGDANQVTCPTCDGQGTIRGVESLTLSILRVIEEESMNTQMAQVRAQVPVDVATFLINEKRDVLLDLEARHKVKILVIANKNISIPHFEVTGVKRDEMPRSPKASYKLVTEKPAETYIQPALAADAQEEPAIQHIKPQTPPPASKSQKESGLIRRLWDAVFGASEKPEENSLKPKQRDKTRSSRHGGQGRQQKDTRRTSGGNRRQNNRRGGRRRSGPHSRSDNRNRDNQYDDNQNYSDNHTRDNHVRDNQARDNQARDNQARDNHENKAIAQDKSQQARSERNQKQDRQPKQDRQDKKERSGRNPRQDRKSKEPRQARPPVVAQQPELRQATVDEKAMFESEQSSLAQNAKNPTIEKQAPKLDSYREVIPSPTREVESEVKAKERDWSETVTNIDAAPIVEETILTPEQTDYRQASRRDQIGFIKMSSEEAKNAFVEVQPRATRDNQAPKLKQVITENKDSGYSPTKAPMSSLIKAHRSTNTAEQSHPIEEPSAAPSVEPTMTHIPDAANEQDVEKSKNIEET